MFSPEERARLRSELLEFAASDKRVSGAAVTGSAAGEGEDRWSDIDLAFGVADGAGIHDVLSDWTNRMYADHRALHHLDVRRGSWIYRVFLLSNTLQVDLAFVPASEFRALAPSFRLVHGKANEPQHSPPPLAVDLIGWAWLYALHARSAIERGNAWQAEYMISGVRDHALALACVRYGVPAIQARGIHRLPKEVTAPFEAGLVRQLEPAELRRAFRAVLRALLAEIRKIDEELAGRLEQPLLSLGDDATIALESSIMADHPPASDTSEGTDLGIN